MLKRLQADGFWLIDVVDRPVNHLPPELRRAAITAAAPQLVGRCHALAPQRGVIICHRAVYQLAAPSLRDAGVRVLHDQPLPFPLGNWWAEFVARLRKALTEHQAGASWLVRDVCLNLARPPGATCITGEDPVPRSY